VEVTKAHLHLTGYCKQCKHANHSNHSNHSKDK
jgi:hypothetical protein